MLTDKKTHESEPEEANPTAPFKDVYHALSYYNHHNPARMKSINFFERDKKKVQGLWTNEQLWSMVCAAMWFGLRPYEKSPVGQVFGRWHLVPREHREHVTPDMIAKELHISRRTFFNYLKKALTAVEHRFWLDSLIQIKLDSKRN